MIDKIMKSVKRGNKKRSINITIGTVVGFLLSCTSVMGAAVEITGDGTDFEVTKSATVIEENTFENNIYTNNGEIKAPSPTEGGIKIEGKSTNKELTIINNGIIDSQNNESIRIMEDTDIKGDIVNNGTMSTAGTNVGIDDKAVVEGKIENNGVMSRNGGNTTINLLGQLTGKIINKGVVDSNTTSKNGNAGIHMTGNMTGNIENEGVVITNGVSGSKETNSGITINSPNVLTGDIINTGFLKTKNIGKGTGTGIYVAGTLTGNGTNNGRITSESDGYSHGIKVDKTASKILNNGYLDIKSTAGSKIGIIVNEATKSIENNGNMMGTGSTESIGIQVNKATGTGKTDGLYNKGIITDVQKGIDMTEKVEKFQNMGVIYGKTNAVNVQNTALQTGTLNNNYGIMIIEGNDASSILNGTKFVGEGDKFGITNYGLAFSVGTGENKGKYFLVENIKHAPGGGGALVITAELNKSADYDATGEVSGTKTIFSSKLGINNDVPNYYIISGINDTLTIDADRVLAQSNVNAYGRAVVMKDGVELSASKGTVFNGGLDKKSETILLKGSSNTLNLSGESIINGITKIDGDSNKLTMDASIQNGSIEATGENNNLSLENSIINGESKISGTGNTLKMAANSRVNGDMLIDGANNDFSMDTSIQNGNIEATGDNNTLSLENGILNGNVGIDGDGNNLALSGEDTYINGDLKAGNGNNKLDITGKSNDGKSLNMFHEVAGFNEMNILAGSVTFFEDSKVTGVKKVNVEETGILNLRLKKTGNHAGTNLNEATHAFSNGNTGMVMEGLDDGGTLRFITNGIGEGVWVDVNDMQIKNMYIEGSSGIDGVYKFDGDGGLVIKAYDDLGDMLASGTKVEDSKNVDVENPDIENPDDADMLKENVFDKENFDSINGIYKGIYSSKNKGDNLDALREIMLFDRNSEAYNESTSKSEQLKNLQAYLNEVYTQSPYGVSSELSRKSVGMFRDIVTENQFRPNLNKWLVMGGLTHVDGGTKDTYYGEVYKLDGKNSSSTDADMKLTGAYALGKYGYSENVALGITAGGNRSEAELSRSKVKGNSGYIGAFAENYRGNLTLKAGAGVQYSEYDADRNTIGGYSYSDKYSDMTYDIYLNGRYSNPIGDNLFLEPYGTLSYTYVDQEGTDEGSKVLAIETDSKSFDYTSAKVGVDLKKVIPHEKGKSTLSAGVSYTRLLSGADSENLTGRYQGGSDFDILIAGKNEHSVGLNAKYTLELENGILFDVKGTYSVERDSHNDDAKNKNKGEWIVGAGLGYKF